MALSSSRAVTNYVLRSESGLGSINFWSPSTWALLKTMLLDHGPTSLRVEACAAGVPAWLEVYLATVLGRRDARLLEALVPVMLERTQQLFPMTAYESTIGQALLHGVLAAFEAAPTLILALRRPLLELLEARRDPAYETLLVHVCWVGDSQGFCAP